MERSGNFLVLHRSSIEMGLPLQVVTEYGKLIYYISTSSYKDKIMTIRVGWHETTAECLNARIKLNGPPISLR